MQDPSLIKTEMGGLNAPVDFLYSPAHNAVYLYFSRIIRPLWRGTLVAVKICKLHIYLIKIVQNENNLQEIQFVSTRVNMDVLNLIEGLVRGFLQFLDTQPSLCPKVEIKTDKPITDAKVVCKMICNMLLETTSIHSRTSKTCHSMP